MIRSITLLFLIFQGFYLSAQVLVDISSNVNINYSGVDSLRMLAGVAVIDYDNDGDDDVLFASSERPIELYRNDGNFNFINVTSSSGLDNINYNISALAAADLDNDGWQDLLMTTIDGQPNLIFKNNSQGGFVDISAQSGITNNKYWGTAITIGDFNKDSFLDFYIGNNAKERYPQIIRANPSPNEFFLSQGEAFNYIDRAIDMSVGGEGYSLAVKFVDFDQDNDLDIYVVNDFGSLGNPNQYYENDNGLLHERGREYGLNQSMFAMGIGYGDYDNDLDFDFYLSDVGSNEFLRNNDNRFTDITNQTKADGAYTSWGGQFVDINNDGLLDIIMTNGGVLDGEINEPFLYYENSGNTFFEYPISLAQQPFFARGMAFSDFDNDGDLDVMVNTVIEKDTLPMNKIKVLQNFAELNSSRNNYLQIQLEAVSENRDALGSLLKLTLEDGTVLMRSKDVGGAYLSVDTKTIHFGLGEQTIKELSITWPNGQIEVFENIPINSLIKIKENLGVEILRTDQVTALDELNTPQFLIYPSLVEDRFYIISKNSQGNRKIDIIISSLTGLEIYKTEFRLTDERGEIPVNLPSGIYLVRILDGSTVSTKRLFVR